MSEGSYIQFGVEGVPFSAIRVELSGDIGADVATAIGAALELQAAYRDAFHGEEVPSRDVQYEPFDIPNADHPNAPRPQQRAPQPNPMPNSSSYGGARFFCPIHNEEVRPSIKNKTMEWDDAVQMEIPASWFHTVGDKTCSVWRSKLQIRLPEAAR